MEEPAKAVEEPKEFALGPEPLVYMTFGTVAADFEAARHIYATAVQAAADLPISVLLTKGKNAPPDLFGDGATTLPANVTLRPFVTQVQVFKHAVLMVCHGGSGTVPVGLAAGVLMVLMPLFADQVDSARCLAAAGLAPCADEITPDALRQTIIRALVDPDARRHAAQAAADFVALPTLDAALDHLLTL